MARDTSKAKSAVMQRKYRMKVEKDKTKFNKKVKHKGRTSDLYFWSKLYNSDKIDSVFDFNSHKVPTLKMVASS